MGDVLGPSRDDKDLIQGNSRDTNPHWHFVSYPLPYHAVVLSHGAESSRLRIPGSAVLVERLVVLCAESLTGEGAMS